MVLLCNNVSETSEEDLKKIVGSDEVIGRANKELDKYGWTKKELAIYYDDMKLEYDKVSCLKQKFNEGIQIGQEKGRAEGKQEAREEGEKQAKIAVAREILADKMDINAITKYTGLHLSYLTYLLLLYHLYRFKGWYLFCQ